MTSYVRQPSEQLEQDGCTSLNGTFRNCKLNLPTFEVEPLRFHVLTWNVNGKDRAGDLEPWLFPPDSVETEGSPPDIIAIGYRRPRSINMLFEHPLNNNVSISFGYTHAHAHWE